MLTDLIDDLMNATTDRERESAYRTLEQIGMDRATARCIINARKEKKEATRETQETDLGH